MPQFFRDDYLRRLRNEVSFAALFMQLNWPHKRRESQLAFVCPECDEYRSSVNPRTNLARCFFCATNFNPIDFTMAARRCTFVEAVGYLENLLPSCQK